MSRLEALEHEVVRLRKLADRRGEKLDALYQKVEDFRTRNTIFMRYQQQIRQQGQMIERLKRRIHELKVELGLKYELEAERSETMKDYNAEVNAIMRFLAWSHHEKDIELLSGAREGEERVEYKNEKLERLLNEYIQQWRSTHPWQ